MNFFRSSLLASFACLAIVGPYEVNAVATTVGAAENLLRSRMQLHRLISLETCRRLREFEDPDLSYAFRKALVLADLLLDAKGQLQLLLNSNIEIQFRSGQAFTSMRCTSGKFSMR